MSRPLTLLVVILVLVVAALVGLASINTAKAPTLVEKDMLNASQAH